MTAPAVVFDHADGSERFAPASLRRET